MGTKYEQLSLEERCKIACLRANGQSVRQIAANLDRSASTISRELKRNSGARDYSPSYASDLAWARRWRGSRLVRQPDLQKTVLNLLVMGWSPEQIAGRLTLEKASMSISHESIYRFVHAQISRTKDYSWRLLLPRKKSKRGFRGRKGGSSAHLIKNRVSIALRPSGAQDRKQPGHWETDYILFRKYGQSVLVTQERRSRFLLLAKPETRQAERTVDLLSAWFRKLPQPLRQTLTQDNGTEFAAHYKLRDELGIQTFFCAPHCPWQKGGIENANGRLRRDLPRKTNLLDWSDADIQAVADRHNNTPRKCLGFQTPAEVFSHQLLHLECESTCPPSRA
jgi:transposase, IS30 family